MGSLDRLASEKPLFPNVDDAHLCETAIDERLSFDRVGYVPNQLPSPTDSMLSETCSRPGHEMYCIRSTDTSSRALPNLVVKDVGHHDTNAASNDAITSMAAPRPRRQAAIVAAQKISEQSGGHKPAKTAAAKKPVAKKPAVAKSGTKRKNDDDDGSEKPPKKKGKKGPNKKTKGKNKKKVTFDTSPKDDGTKTERSRASAEEVEEAEMQNTDESIVDEEELEGCVCRRAYCKPSSPIICP